MIPLQVMVLLFAFFGGHAWASTESLSWIAWLVTAALLQIVVNKARSAQDYLKGYRKGVNDTMEAKTTAQLIDMVKANFDKFL